MHIINVYVEVTCSVLLYMYIRISFIHVHVICIWYPFQCDMGLDGTLTSHIERVADEFDMACQSAIYRTRMDNICIFSHEITLNLSFTTKKRIIEMSQPPLQTSAIWRQIRNVLNIET